MERMGLVSHVEDELERVIERARHQRLVHLDPLIVRFLQLARPGRDGIVTVRQVLLRLDPTLEPAETSVSILAAPCRAALSAPRWKSQPTISQTGSVSASRMSSR